MKKQKKAFWETFKIPLFLIFGFIFLGISLSLLSKSGGDIPKIVSGFSIMGIAIAVFYGALKAMNE